MIEETARVVAIEGEFAWVETERKSTCQSCAANKGCGTAVLSQTVGKRLARMKALNEAKARVGARVLVGIDEQALVRGSLAVYGVPLACMLGAAIVMDLLVGAELAVILGGMLGLAGGFFWLRYFAERISKNANYQAVILREIAQDQPTIVLHSVQS
ncbi:MAG: SoxR reducing system RseC family protein [Pseudomonadota bacterium]